MTVVALASLGAAAGMMGLIAALRPAEYVGLAALLARKYAAE